MTVESKLADGVIYIFLHGEIDDSYAEELRNKIDELTRGQIKKAVFDFKGVTFMDSTGIGILLGRYKLLKARGIPIFIANPQSVVDRVFSLSGIYQIMPKVNNGVI